ncbi:MAG: septum site-determining protein MinD [Clostridia bacterium]|jgi:septum site-determining protein MinD|nr:septum site-determining protein MinD [Clostridia bacterium]MCX4367120.1 septum site-determining protein MinD [Clostridia bacterium]
MARRIVITSGKGGVGKTTVTANIGIFLAKRGHKTLLIDGDVGLNNLDVVLGIENKAVYDMADVLEGKCRISQALIPYDESGMLMIMPSAHAYNSEDIGSKNFRNLVGRLDSHFDYILIDCPAGIEGGFHRAVSAANEAVVVTTPQVSSIRDADKVIALLSSYELNSVSVIVNRIRGDLVIDGEMMDVGEVAKLLKITPIGAIPEDDYIGIYSQLGRLGEQSGESKDSFSLIVSNIVNGKRRIYDCTSKYRGLLGKIRLKLKRNA